MYTDVVQWTLIRKKALKNSLSIRQISRDTGLHRYTVRKILKYERPHRRQRTKRILHRKLGRHIQYIHTLLDANKVLPPAFRLTMQRIFEELRDERGYDGSYSTVRDYIRKNGGDTRYYIGKVRRNMSASPFSIWEIMYGLLTLLPKKDVINTLHLLSNGKSPVIAERKLEEWLRSYEGRYNVNLRPSNKEIARREARDWMHAVMQKSISREKIRRETGDIDGLQQLLGHLYNSGLNQRNRALCVLAEAKGIPRSTIYTFLDIHKATGLKYIKAYKTGGVDALYGRKRSILKKAEDDSIKQTVFSTLHEPPSIYGINRTTWKMKDLVTILRQKGVSVNKDVIRRIIRDTGFKWRKARTVLTSKDPAYREKLERIQNILRNLQADEAFFSIDEYGPFAVKMKGGRKLVGPAEEYTVPQWQKSRGSLIITAALELSGNQVTHFYSDKKNTDEMIKLTDILVEKYRTHKKIWLSWDAASWHISKKLYEHIEKVNGLAAIMGGPIVETAPLPAGAQFLNVIESIFSGMARSIIHNSDYISIDEAKIAIDRNFDDRNEHFFRNPRRAGKKIWGQERVISEFEEANNCKDPAYR